MLVIIKQEPFGHQTLELRPTLDPGFAFSSSLPLDVFMLEGAILFKLKDGNLESFFIRILFDLKESFNGLHPFKNDLLVQVSLKLWGIKFHVP